MLMKKRTCCVLVVEKAYGVRSGNTLDENRTVAQTLVK